MPEDTVSTPKPHAGERVTTALLCAVLDGVCENSIAVLEPTTVAITRFSQRPHSAARGESRCRRMTLEILGR